MTKFFVQWDEPSLGATASAVVEAETLADARAMVPPSRPGGRTPPPASREKREQWLQQCGGTSAAIRRASEMVYQRGLDWFTDEQIEDMVRDDVENWKRREKLNRENRARLRANA